MKKVYVFFADGFEEIEALTVVDILKRADINVLMVSVKDTYEVCGAHDIKIQTDLLFEEIQNDADMLVLPGGMPGTLNLKAHNGLQNLLIDYNDNKKYIAAICAAPTILGELGFLRDKMVTCYPSFAEEIDAKEYTNSNVVISDNIITSAGMGTAIDFSLKLLEILVDQVTANKMSSTIVYK